MDRAWYVGGLPVASQLSFQVIDIPGSLQITGTPVIVTENGICGTSYYGVFADVEYLIIGKQGGTYNTQIGLEPQTSLNSDSFEDVGPAAGYPDSSQYANMLGLFHDVPYGACVEATSPPETFPYQFDTEEVLQIVIGSNAYPVRTNYWYWSSSGVDHGVWTNNNDIYISR